MKSRIFSCTLILSLLSLTSTGATPEVKNEGWSSAINGMQARLTLVQEDEQYGTRWLVPYLELRNVRDVGNQMEVNCDRHHLTVELVNAKGEPIRSGWTQPRSGPSSEMNTLILPWHSSITLSLENRNWMVPRNSPAMISTESGAWVLEGNEKGKVFLRATLTDEPIEPSPWKRWYGTIQTELLKVDWK